MDLEEECTAEAALLEDAKERLAQLEVANRESEAAATSACLGQGDGSIESQIVFCRRRVGCRSPDHRMQEASHHVQTSAEIPLMPTHVPKDLDDWMCDRNLYFQEALSLGDCPQDLEVVRGGSTNVHFDWCHADLIWTNAREVSLYGCHGVQGGDASHPGLLKSPLRRCPVDHIVRRGVQCPALREARGDGADSVGAVHVEPAQGVVFGVHVVEVGDSASGVDHTLPDDVSGSVQSRDDDRSLGNVDEVLPGLESDLLDTESMAGSDFSGEVEQESIPDVEIVHEAFRTNSAAIRAGFHGLVAVELPLMLDRRAPVMKNEPHFLRGAFRNFLRWRRRVSVTQVDVSKVGSCSLMPRMLLHRPATGGNVPRTSCSNDSTHSGEARLRASSAR